MCNLAFQFFSFLVVNTKEPSNLRSFFLASRSAWRVWCLEFGRYCRFFFTSNHAGQRLSGQCCIVALCSFLCCRCLGFHASVLWHTHERLQIHFKLFRMQGRSRISVLCRKIFHSRYMCGMSDFQGSLGKKYHAFCVSCVILISAFTKNITQWTSRNLRKIFWGSPLLVFSLDSRFYPGPEKWTEGFVMDLRRRINLPGSKWQQFLGAALCASLQW